jgi:hypothetical protein
MGQDRPVLNSPFASLAEWDDWTNASCRSSTDDDRAVLMGAGGRRATRDELEAYLAEHKARLEREAAQRE